MTKKSDTRLARDQLKKNSRMWDDLEHTYQNISTTLRGPHDELVKVYSQPLVYQSVPNKQETANAFRTLASDMGALKADLAAIYALHQGRTGGYTSDQDQDLGIHVFEQYTGFQTRYNAVILPALIFLTEQADKARMIVADYLAAEAAKDPNVITDIVAKPVSEADEVVAVNTAELTGEITTDPQGNPLSQEDAAVANGLLAKYPVPVGIAVEPSEPLDQVDVRVAEAQLTIAASDAKEIEQTQSE